MCLDTLDVVEVCLPVLDDAVLVGGNQPFVVVRVGSGAKSAVVCLHDRLEVEAGTVPQRELATGAAGEKTSTFGRPFHHVDRMFHFI